MIKTRLVRLLEGAKKYIAYQILWQWIALLTNIGAMASVGRLLERVIAGEGKLSLFLGTAALLAAVLLVRLLCDHQAARASFLASKDVKRILRDKIYEKLLRLGPSYKERVATSEVVQVSTEGVEQLEIYFGKYLPQLFYSLLAPVTLFALLAFVDWRPCLVLLLFVPLIPVSIVLVQKVAKRLLGKYWSSYTELGDSFLENLQGLATLKIYRADAQKSLEMDRESEHFRKVTMKVLTMQLNSTSVMDIVAYGGAAVGMILTVQDLLAGKVGLAGAFTIIMLSAEFFLPLRLLGSFFHIAMNGMAASDKIFRILDLEEPREGTGTLEDRTQSGKEIRSEGLDIVMENVAFSYEKERKILDGVTIAAGKGGMVSLVGASGCGKSTVARILTGQNREYEGSVRVGGQELASLSVRSLLDHVTLVRHDSRLIKGTVRENLHMGNPKAGDGKLEQALRDVNLWDFLSAQQGLDTQLLENGSNLSGGQRQRLCMARALLHDTPVYIFDEATSNIDVESEEQIMNVIRRLAKSRTVVLISHRLANVVDSECIYMMKDGRIAECGTHAALMAKKGSYAALYQSQRELEQYGWQHDGCPRQERGMER